MNKFTSNRLVIVHGIIAGILMALIMSILAIQSDYRIGVIKYIKYLPLIFILYISAKSLKSRIKKKQYFPTILSSGIKIPTIAGLILSFSIIFLFAINPSFAPMKFNLLPSNWLDTMTIAAMQLFETIALGFILNLIIFQYAKFDPKTLSM